MDGQDDKVIGTFDGERHVLLEVSDDSAASVRWSDAATPVSDVKKALTILRRFNSAGIRWAPRACRRRPLITQELFRHTPLFPMGAVNNADCP